MGIMNKEFVIGHKLKTAEEYEASGQYLHAIQIYKTISDENPENSEVMIKTAGLYRKMGNSEAAENILNNFLHDYPESPEVRFFLGEIMLNDERWEEAIEIFDFLSPEEEPVIAYFLGYSYLMLKDFEIAKINFQKFISLNKEGELYFEACYNLAKADIELKNYEAAVPYLKIAEPILSEWWEFNYNTALTYYHLGMYAHAVPYIEKSLKSLKAADVHLNLAGKIYLRLGDYIKAESCFRKFIKLKEEIPADTYALLAETCLHINKIPEAIKFFDKALETDPMNKIALDGKRNAAEVLVKGKKASDG
jgi:tetratricopeptide (TPR) repeat protein